MSQIRAYSTDSDRAYLQGLQSSKEQSQTASLTDEDIKQRAQPTSSDNQDVQKAGFQSLSALFRHQKLNAHPGVGARPMETQQNSEGAAKVEKVVNTYNDEWPRFSTNETSNGDTITANTHNSEAPVIRRVSASLPIRRTNRAPHINNVNGGLVRKTGSLSSDAPARTGRDKVPPPAWRVSNSVPSQNSTAATATPESRWTSITPEQDDIVPTVNLITESDRALTENISTSSQTSKPAVLTHLTSTGEAHMVDISDKQSTTRAAVACGFVKFSNPDPIRLISENSNKKGDVLGVARIAGIMAAKRCSDIIPLCHPIAISKVTVNVSVILPNGELPYNTGVVNHGAVLVEARVHCGGSTGVEMEAMTAVMASALTVYDMCKAVDRKATMGGVKLLLKEGGKSGRWVSDVWEPWHSWRMTRDTAQK